MSGSTEEDVNISAENANLGLKFSAQVISR